MELLHVELQSYVIFRSVDEMIHEGILFRWVFFRLRVVLFFT